MNALHRVENALTKVGLSDIILKPQQVQCFEYLLEGYDVIAVLPTGFGKSLLFQSGMDKRQFFSNFFFLFSFIL